MDGISALKMMVPPEMGGQLTKVLQDAKAGGIPAAELQTLNAGAAAAARDLPGVAGATGSSGSFQHLLGDFVNEVSQKQAAAGDAVNGLLSGKNVSLHQAMISMEEASVSFQMMVEVRNKLLESYQELMRMQV